MEPKIKREPALVGSRESAFRQDRWEFYIRNRCRAVSARASPISLREVPMSLRSRSLRWRSATSAAWRSRFCKAELVGAEVFALRRPKPLFRRCDARLWRDVDRMLAVAIREGFGIDLFELDRAAHHTGLPRIVLRIGLEVRHHFLGEQF